jgi:large subunit ribosomal protein L35
MVIWVNIHNFANSKILPVRLNKFLVCSRTPAGCNLNQIIFMPKVKTNSSAKKRFKVTGTGEITFQKAFKRHILTKKSKKRKRNMRKAGLVGSANKDFVQRLLGLK